MAAVEAVDKSWRRLGECRTDGGPEADGQDRGVEEWVLRAMAGFAEAESIAREAKRDLARVAIRDLSLSSVRVGAALGVANSTVLRWLPPGEE